MGRHVVDVDPADLILFSDVSNSVFVHRYPDLRTDRLTSVYKQDPAGILPCCFQRPLLHEAGGSPVPAPDINDLWDHRPC